MESLLALGSPLLSPGGNLLNRAGVPSHLWLLVLWKCCGVYLCAGSLQTKASVGSSSLLWVSVRRKREGPSPFLAGHLIQGLFDLPLYLRQPNMGAAGLPLPSEARPAGGSSGWVPKEVVSLGPWGWCLIPVADCRSPQDEVGRCPELPKQ